MQIGPICIGFIVAIKQFVIQSLSKTILTAVFSVEKLYEKK